MATKRRKVRDLKPGETVYIYWPASALSSVIQWKEGVVDRGSVKGCFIRFPNGGEIELLAGTHEKAFKLCRDE